MSRKTKPGLPDVAVAHQAIRLADALAAARRRSTTAEDLAGPRLPEYVALLEHLSRLQDDRDRMAQLHALFWLGSRPSSTARAYDALYQHALANLDLGASYLVAKPLGDALRRGLEKLGRPADPIPARPVGVLHPVAHNGD
jgi:Protein of unknown function (DUF3775)